MQISNRKISQDANKIMDEMTRPHKATSPPDARLTVGRGRRCDFKNCKNNRAVSAKEAAKRDVLVLTFSNSTPNKVHGDKPCKGTVL